MFKYRIEILLGIAILASIVLRLSLFENMINLYETERTVPLANYGPTPSGRGYAFDPHDYLLLASRIASGRGYSYEDGSPTAFRPPLYPTFLSFLRPGFPFSSALPIWANFALSTLAISLFVWTIKIECGTKLAFPALVVFVFDNKWLQADSHVWSEPLLILLLASAVFICSMAKQDKKRPSIQLSLAALPLGLSCLVSPVTLVAIPLFSIALFLFDKRKVGVLVAFLVLSFVIIAPWTLRNAVVTGSFIPIAANGGMNLYIGNNAEGIEWSYQIYDSKTLNEIQQKGSSESGIDKEFYKRSFEYIRAEPSHFVSRFLSKARTFWAFFPRESLLGKVVTVGLLFPCVILGAFRVIRYKKFGGIIALILLSTGFLTYSSFWVWWRMAIPYAALAWLLVFNGVQWLCATTPRLIRCYNHTIIKRP